MTTDQEKNLRCTINPGSDEWTIENPGGAGRSLPIYLDLHKVEKIQVEIHAPDKHDPGQLLQLRNQTLSLVSAIVGFPRGHKIHSRFRPANHQAMLDAQCQPCCPRAAGRGSLLPEMEIEFFEQRGRGSWFDNTMPQQSIEELECSDLELIVDVFEYLRHVTRASISFPFTHSIPWYKFLTDCTSIVCKSMTSTEPFNALLTTDDENSNPNTYTHAAALTSFREADRSIALETILDDLPGPTAASLRLSRFAAWEWHHPRTEALIAYSALTPGEQGWETSKLTSREIAYESWHPDNMGPDWDSDQDGWVWVGEDYADETERWQTAFPDGIPPVSSPEWQRYMQQWGVFVWRSGVVELEVEVGDGEEGER